MTTFVSQQTRYTIYSSIVTDNYPDKDTLISLSGTQMHFKHNKVTGRLNAIKVCHFKSFSPIPLKKILFISHKLS